LAKKCPKCALLSPPTALRCDCGFDFRVHQGVKSPGLSYAGFWPRAWALVVDLLLWPPFIALHVAIYSWYSTTAWVLSGFVLGMIRVAYPIYFHARWGQTVGKMVARIKVTRPDGTRIMLRHAFLRNAVDLMLWVLYTSSTMYVLAAWPASEWSLIGRDDQHRLLVEHNPLFGTHDALQQAWMWSELLVLLFNKKRRALHDFIAGTVVIKVVTLSR
jgi:uncharacterized RDD family membrane protein YckC